MKKKFLKLFGLSALMLGALYINKVSAEETPVKAVATPEVSRDLAIGTTPPPVSFSKPHIVFHYQRSDSRYDNYALWIWGHGEEGKVYTFDNEDGDYGVWLSLPIDTFADESQLYIIIRTKTSWNEQTANVNIKLKDYQDAWNEGQKAYNFYLLDMYTRVYPSREAALASQIFSAEFTGPAKIKVVTNHEPTSYNVQKGLEVVASGTTSGRLANGIYDFTINLPGGYQPDLLAAYTLEVVFKNTNVATGRVSITGLFDDAYFVERLTYTGTDLGVTYTPQATTIKAWAPTSQSLKLRIYNNGTPKSVSTTLGDDTYVEHNFVYGDKGVWSITLQGDYHGKYYTFVTENIDETIELIDPYAKAAGVSGIRGLIVDFSKTDPDGWAGVDYSVKKQTEIIPYELHVADLTADSTWQGSEENRKRYLGLIEEGTTYSAGGVSVKTGFDHIRELGINALQILPFYDQENDETQQDFNWGYNPQNYNVLEGSYSKDPYDGLVRIREFKQVVKAYAKEDIRIIMDVVYNHVANLSEHSFNKLVPGYYFRLLPDGSPSNTSGVGNVTAAERIMMENFMRDSTAFWVDEYKIGGFRFDLMGLHTVKSMNTVMTNLKTLREDIIVYGEAWNMDQSRGDLAHQGNVHQVAGVGAFNDQIREGVSPNDRSPGWVQKPADELVSNVKLKNRVRDGLLGKITDSTHDPIQVINYVACHDNNTLYDKIYSAGYNMFNGDLNRLSKQSLQAESLVLLAQGVSFIHAGSEMLRSKPLPGGGFDHNSYKSSYEINSIKWNEKITNLSVVNYYQQLIAIKREVPAFQYSTRTAVDANVTVEYGSSFGLNDDVIRLKTKDTITEYIVYFIGTGAGATLSDVSNMQVIVDTSGTLGRGDIVSGNPRLPGNTTLVVRKNTTLPLPGADIEIIAPPTEPPAPKQGCGGSISATLIVSLLLVGVALSLSYKRKQITKI